MRRALRIAGLLAMAIVWTGASNVTPAEELGRLFFSPDERANLDALRGAPAKEEPPAATPTASSLTVNGVVRSSGGRSVVWVNGVPTEPGRPDATGTVVPKGVEGTSVTLLAPNQDKALKVKVGETIEIVPPPQADAPEPAPGR